MSCQSCKYFSGIALLPCAVNPTYNQDSICKNYEEIQEISYHFCYGCYGSPTDYATPTLQVFKGLSLEKTYFPRDLKDPEIYQQLSSSLCNPEVAEFFRLVERCNHILSNYDKYAEYQVKFFGS